MFSNFLKGVEKRINDMGQAKACPILFHLFINIKKD